MNDPKLNFSKRFPYSIYNYLTEKKHFVETDSNISSLSTTNLNISQGYFPKTFLLNWFAVDIMKILTESQCIQYSDDSSEISKLKELFILQL